MDTTDVLIPLVLHLLLCLQSRNDLNYQRNIKKIVSLSLPLETHRLPNKVIICQHSWVLLRTEVLFVMGDTSDRGPQSHG